MTTPNSFLSHEFLLSFIITLISVASGLKLLFTDLSHLGSIFQEWHVRWEQKEPKVDTQEIISTLRDERDRIDAAIIALEGVGSNRRRRAVGSNGASRGGRRMSAAARRKISLAQKKRWAKQKQKS